ncbi:MAG: class I SAM-dependent methyltransferase [Candidatus Thermoplasmatota archaeon]
MKKIVDYAYMKSMNVVFLLNMLGTRQSIYVMKNHFNKKKVIGAEIGVLRGYNTRNILRHLNIDKIYLIDPYMMYEGIDEKQDPKVPHSKAFLYAQKVLKKYKEKIIWIRKMSSEAINDVPENLDFVYIDGNHLYDYVLKDLELYYPKVKPGGVLCGHDFNHPDVARAVAEFSQKKKVSFQTHGYPTDWWIKK